MINIGGTAKQGVVMGTYGPNEEGKNYKNENNIVVGYIQPAGDYPKWIAWFTLKGDMVIYTSREPNGGVIGDPIRISHKGGWVPPYPDEQPVHD